MIEHMSVLQAAEAEKKLTLQVSNHHTVIRSGEYDSSCRLKHITWRELSITKAKPNFESLILMDHFGG